MVLIWELWKVMEKEPASLWLCLSERAPCWLGGARRMGHRWVLLVGSKTGHKGVKGRGLPPGCLSIMW